jgi:sugar lactone lactonase YvrE
MKRLLRLRCYSTLGGLSALAAVLLYAPPPAVPADTPAALPELNVAVAKDKPTIDGKLDDACWKDAAEIKLLEGAKKGATSARVCRDADHLYIAVIAKLAGSATKDEVTLLINANGDRNSHYLIAIAPSGAVQTSYREESPPWQDVTWRPKLNVKIGGSDGEWIAEMALPLAIFNMNKTVGPVVGFNIRRQDSGNGEAHCWRPEFSARDCGSLKGIPPRPIPSPVAVEKAPIQLGAGSAHPGNTGEVKLELQGFMMGSDPHSRGVIWDLAVNEKAGELYVLSVPRVRNPPEVQVFDRQGKYLRTVMPYNPTLPREKVKDLAQGLAVEGGISLIQPKRFEIFGAVETSLYGEWMHFPQKIVVAPNGDLLLSNLYRSTLWRLKPDGSLPAEGWTSLYSPQRNEPFESHVDIGKKHTGGLNPGEEWYGVRLANYLPFPELFYPYMAFDKDGNLCISRGIYYKSSGLQSLAEYARYWEIPREPNRQLPDTTAVWFKMGVLDGVKVDNIKGYGFDGSEQPLPPQNSPPGRKEISKFVGQCGLAFDGNHLVLSDTKDGRLLVFDAERKQVANVTQYKSGGKEVAFANPTALAVDNQGAIYVLVSGKDKQVLKLKSWREPELLAASGPLHKETLQIALDRQANPPIVWVSNGAGLGSLVQLAGNDLSVKGKWGDSNESLVSPVQQGYMPILNVDPETGYLYVEDNSHFRFGKRGPTYRLDQNGKILKKIPADPKEMPRLETLFGRDGKLYWWEKGGLWRYDRKGEPLPFKTGTPAPGASGGLLVDQKVHHVGIYMGMDVDKDGNIYYVNAQSKLDVYDADGNLKKKGLIDLNAAVRGIQVDSSGYIYALSRRPPKLLPDTILEVYNAPQLHLAKYSPEGKVVWSIPWTGITGRDQVLVAGCGCLRPRIHQALDDKGYLYAANWNSVRVIDTETGKVVGEFGSYGNMDCQGKGSKYAHPELPFGTISALAVWKDKLFVVDQLNRRIVKCQIVYKK